MIGDGLDGHVREQAEGVAFEGVAEAAEGPGQADRGLTPAAAPATAEPAHGQSKGNGLAADRDRPQGAVFGPVANHLRRLAVGAAVVSEILLEMEREDAVRRGRSQALVLAKPERAIQSRRGHAVLLKTVQLPFRKRHAPLLGPLANPPVRSSRMSQVGVK